MKKREKKNKKAQAGIITVVLLILIVFVAVMILWNFLNPYFKAKSKEVEEKGEVLNVNLGIEDAVLFPTGASRVSVYRKAGKGELSSLKFVFYDEQGNSDVETIEDNLPQELETKTYSFSPFAELGKIKNVAVLPVIGKGTGIESREETSKVFEIPNGLVSWWKFDNGGEDFVGKNNCNNVNVVDDATRNGKVASFNDVEASCGSDTSLDITNKIAVSFWLKTGDEDGTIIKKGGNYEISLNNSKIEFSYTSGELKKAESSADVADGKWHHVVVSEDWQGDRYLRIYIDRSLDNQISMPEIPNTNSDNLIIGENFQGSIDEIMFFNESLAITQVESIYNSQK